MAIRILVPFCSFSISALFRFVEETGRDWFADESVEALRNAIKDKDLDPLERIFYLNEIRRIRKELS